MTIGLFSLFGLTDLFGADDADDYSHMGYRDAHDADALPGYPAPRRTPASSSDRDRLTGAEAGDWVCGPHWRPLRRARRPRVPAPPTFIAGGFVPGDDDDGTRDGGDDLCDHPLVFFAALGWAVLITVAAGLIIYALLKGH